MGRILSAVKKVVPVVVELITIAYVAPAPGWTTVGDAFKNKEYAKGAQSVVAGFTGIRLDVPQGGQRGISFDPFGTLNPVDFDHAPFSKIGGWAVVAMEGIGATMSFAKGIVKDLFGAVK